MASDAVSDLTEDAVTPRSDEAVSPVEPKAEGIGDRLASLSRSVALCNTVLSDLKDLGDALQRKNLQDASLPPQK